MSLFSAGLFGPDIPDSAIHRWKYDEGSGSTAADSIGSADGSVVGPTWVSDPGYQGGAALDGDGSDDYVDTTTLGGFGSSMDTDFAFALTINDFSGVSGSQTRMAGVFSTGSSGNMGMLPAEASTSGAIELRLDDANFDSYTVATDSGGFIDDQNKHRILWNKVANSGDDGIEIYLADASDSSPSYTQLNTTATKDQGFSSVEDFTDNFYHFAFNDAGSAKSNINAKLDDIILYNDSLTSSERANDLSLQPWA